MPWYQSFDNIAKLLIILVGAAMLFTGKTELGMGLLASSGVLAAAKAVDNKKGKQVAGILLLSVMVFGSGCQAMQDFSTETMALNNEVYNQYDQYVINDVELDEFDKQQLLRNTVILRQVFNIMQQGMTTLNIVLPPED